MQQNNGQLPPPTKPVPDQRPPLKPIVITDTKQFIKDNAFKPGWNLPTVSIEQAAEIDYQDMLRREARQKETERKKRKSSNCLPFVYANTHLLHTSTDSMVYKSS